MREDVRPISTGERVLHWITVLSFLALVVSGLGLYSNLFSSFLTLFGGGVAAIKAHKSAGLVFFVCSLFLVFIHLKEFIKFDGDDAKWLKKLGGYFSRDVEHFKIGKFNAGQKIFGLIVGISTLLMGATGFIIWSPLDFSLRVVRFAMILHSLLFVLFGMLIIFHGYVAAIYETDVLQRMLWKKSDTGRPGGTIPNGK